MYSPRCFSLADIARFPTWRNTFPSYSSTHSLYFSATSLAFHTLFSLRYKGVTISPGGQVTARPGFEELGERVLDHLLLAQLTRRDVFRDEIRQVTLHEELEEDPSDGRLVFQGRLPWRLFVRVASPEQVREVARHLVGGLVAALDLYLRQLVAHAHDDERAVAILDDEGLLVVRREDDVAVVAHGLRVDALLFVPQYGRAREVLYGLRILLHAPRVHLVGTDEQLAGRVGVEVRREVLQSGRKLKGLPKDERHEPIGSLDHVLASTLFSDEDQKGQDLPFPLHTRSEPVENVLIPSLVTVGEDVPHVVEHGLQ
mmetsp:Transcript_9884/g.20837  ORF Transcript_9884/g.20837 Transcript_9884/m.20837 type:complete len:314 (+) Transcript_9884:733-1674(+)